MDRATLLHDRHHLDQEPSANRMASTCLATDQQDGQPCVVKRLTLADAVSGPVAGVGAVSGSDAEKLIERFGREAGVFAHLELESAPSSSIFGTRTPANTRIQTSP